MKHFFAAALAFVSATAFANIQYDLNGVTVTANVEPEFFDSYTFENTGTNQWHIFATIDLLKNAVPEFTFNFNLSGESVGDIYDGFYFTSVSVRASEVIQSLPLGAFLFSNSHSANLITSGPMLAYNGSNDFTASASKSIGGGYGVLPSNDPTCQSLACMMPFQLKNTFVFEATIQTIPEPATVGMVLAGGLMIPFLAALRRKKMANQK